MALTMERGNKKRRFNLNNIDTNSDNDNDNDNDDVKMEKFFALIRSANDIRGQLMGPIQTAATATATITTTKDRKVESAVWQPSFRPEDFGGGGGVIHTDITVIKNDVDSSSRVSKEDGDNRAADQSNSIVQGGGGGGSGTATLLDLNLSL